MNEHWKLDRRWISKGAKLFLFIAILVAAIYWVKFTPVPVGAYVVERESIIHEVMGTGTLDARIKGIISSKISGRIEKVLVDQGDKVVAGKLLLKLNDDQLKLQVEIALASLETAQSGVDKTQGDLEVANVILTNATKTYNRYKKLLLSKTISQEAFDKATEELEMARAQASRAEAAIIEARKKVVETRRTLELRRTQLTDAQIRAPFDGLILKRMRDPGNVVVPGTPILSIISTKELWISAWVDESEMSEVETGQPARIVFRSKPDISYPGKVVRLARETDRETREFIIDVHVFELPKNWAIGQRAEVYIETAKKDNTIIIPSRYIKWHDNTPGVFVNSTGLASWQPVKIGLRGRDSLEIIEGLKEGYAVVSPVNPENVLTDQMRISVQ